MKPEDVIKEFDEKFKKNGLFGDFGYGEGTYDIYDEVNDFLISTIISIYKEDLKEIEKMEKPRAYCMYVGDNPFEKDNELTEEYNSALSDLHTKLESKIKEWELIQANKEI